MGGNGGRSIYAENVLGLFEKNTENSVYCRSYGVTAADTVTVDVAFTAVIWYMALQQQIAP